MIIIFKSFINLYGWKIVTQSYFHQAFITSVIICILSGTISTIIAIVVSFLNFFLGQKNKYLKINLNVLNSFINSSDVFDFFNEKVRKLRTYFFDFRNDGLL